MNANRHCDRQTQRGQSTVEYAGIGFIVVAIIATITTLFAAGQGVPLAQAVVCKITTAIHSVGGNDDSYSCEYSQVQGKDPRKVDPASVPSHVEEKKASTSAGVSIPGAGPGTIDVNGSDGKSVKKTTNRDGSGSRQLSSTQQGSAGYTVGGSTDGKGGGGKDKKNPFSAKLQASGAVSVSHTIFHAKSMISRTKKN